ncbi:hypothetical protein FOZ63_032067 [Perkinsus olseni]|uniref:Uncharacterized protein n=1 Tax=Perkinsus olseni TaxID=32597 RepID=A0A7J6TAH6_PEROL|nr:hypothetical protein FOZ63_032067 [Perkinsus olseni]
MPPRRRQVRDKCPTCGKFKGKGVPCRFCAARQAQATNTASQQPPTPSAPSSPPASSQPQLPHPQEPQTQDVSNHADTAVGSTLPTGGSFPPTLAETIESSPIVTETTQGSQSVTAAAAAAAT